MILSSFLLGQQGKGLLFLGFLLFLFGILIAAYPEILVWIISSFFILVGVILFSIGLQIYQRKKKMNAAAPFMDYSDVWQLKK
jgi:hypothetical protein